MSYNSDHFDLSNWKITLPEDKSGGNNGTAKEVENLIGYEHSEYFYDAPDGAMVFSAGVDDATTSGSKYARSELREMNGDERAAWNLKQGGTMTATLKVDEIPNGSGDAAGRLMVGQIHGQDDELIRLYYEEGGHIYFMNDQAGSSNKEMKFTFKNAEGKEPNIALGEKFSYMIDAHGSKLTVKILADGQEYTSTSSINSVWQSDSFYFKAGVYLGNNETNGSGNGQTSFYGLDFSHEAGKGMEGWNTDNVSVTPPVNNDPDPVPVPDPVPPSLPGGNDGGTTDSGVWADAGKGGESISGGSANNTLTGSDDNDVMKGGGGADSMKGGTGSDYMEGNDGNDILNGEAGNDVIRGGAGSDTYVYKPGDGADHILDFSTGDTIDITAFGFTSYDKFMQSVTLESTAEGLVIDFGGGNKLVANGLQIDEVDTVVKLTNGQTTSGDNTSTVVTPPAITPPSGNQSVLTWKDLLGENTPTTEGTDANNTMYGTGGRNIIDGKGGNDVIKGGGGDDVLHGGMGNDFIAGNDGNDLLIGGSGGDTLHGGDGNDSFAFADAKEGGDIITDFDRDEGDTLNLHLLAENALQNTGSDDYFSDDIVVIQEAGSVNHVMVDADGTGGNAAPSLLVTVMGDLMESDFIF